MNPITPRDLLSPKDYEPLRKDRVAKIIEVKERRRLEVGPWISCCFESRATVVHQIQEMIRIERITEPAAVDHEIETFADLAPREGELSLTLFIEISEPELRKSALAALGGIEKSLTLSVNGEEIPAFDKRPIDPRWERPGQATAVYYLGFKLSPRQRQQFAASEGEVWIKFSHPRYRHAAALTEEQRRELSSDFC